MISEVRCFQNPFGLNLRKVEDLVPIFISDYVQSDRLNFVASLQVTNRTTRHDTVASCSHLLVHGGRTTGTEEGD